MARGMPHDRTPGWRFDFDGDGPLIGSVRLLGKTGEGYRPKTREALESELTAVFGGRFDCSVLALRLDVVSRSLNQGDIAKAAIATQFLDLPPRLEGATAAALIKAAVDDPKHPGWPAGAPDSEGGEFRPHDDSGLRALDIKGQRIARRQKRRSFRAILGRVLTAKRTLRLLGELIGDFVPGLDVVTGPASIIDDMKLLEEIADEVRGSKAALDFAEQAPWNLEDLLVSDEGASFASYAAFVKLDLEMRFGPAGEDVQYHHIVEQTPNADTFSQEMLQSTTNIIRLPALVHEKVSAFYGEPRIFLTGKMPLREFLRGKSFEQQRAWGLWALKQVGAIK